MKLTIRQLRRIIRESISDALTESELNRARQKHSQPNELAGLLGWDWYSLDANEKLAMGDVLRGVMLGFNDAQIDDLLQQLPAEKNFVITAPGRTTVPDDVKLDTKSMIKKIKANYIN